MLIKTIMKRILPAILLLGLLTACNMSGLSAVTTGVKEHSILTGECLIDNCLLTIPDESSGLPYREESFYNPVTKKMDYGIIIPLVLNLDKEYRTITKYPHPGICGWLPSANVYKQFGHNAQQVENAFYQATNSVLNGPQSRTESITVFNSNDIVITADREVCGIPAGVNLYPSVVNYNYSAIYDLPQDTIPEGFVPLSMNVKLFISTEGREVISDYPLYHIEIPVKVGMYLKYLNDARTNPNAKMEYRDNVITCDVKARTVRDLAVEANQDK